MAFIAGCRSPIWKGEMRGIEPIARSGEINSRRTSPEESDNLQWSAG
jgi:hypothetical protein